MVEGPGRADRRADAARDDPAKPARIRCRRRRPRPDVQRGPEKRAGGADPRHGADGAREICRGARRLRSPVARSRPGSTRRSAPPRSTASPATREPPTTTLAATLDGAVRIDGAGRAWAETLLGEIAHRRGDPAAERHFRAALEANPRDLYLLGAYCDWLLDQQRAADVDRARRQRDPGRYAAAAARAGATRGAAAGSRGVDRDACARASRRAAPAATRCTSARTRDSSSCCAATREAPSRSRSTTGKCSASRRISASLPKPPTPPAMLRPGHRQAMAGRDGIRISGGRRPGRRRRSGAAK